MSKPDWATRIQKSRQKKYDEGFEAGVLLGYDLGRADMRAEAVKLLEGEKERSGQSLDGIVEVWAGLKLAIALIKGENK